MENVAILVTFEGEIMDTLGWYIDFCSHGKRECRR